jgi:hypothetical protein
VRSFDDVDLGILMEGLFQFTVCSDLQLRVRLNHLRQIRYAVENTGDKEHMQPMGER